MYTETPNDRAALLTGPARQGIDRTDAVLALLLFVVTIGIAVAFAAGGGYSGFINMGHDGYNLQQMIDLQRGGTVFKDTWEQYGPFGPYLNLVGFKVFGGRLLALRYTVAFWYGLSGVLLYFTARQFMNQAWAVFAGMVWLSLGPFFQQGVMISVHAYILFAQAAATFAIVKFVDTPKRGLLVVAGLFCGVSCIVKQSVGFVFAVGIGVYFMTRAFRRPYRLSAEALNLTIVGASTLAVILSTLGWMWVKGALPDWYRQSILFPQQFYLGAEGGAAKPGSGPVSLFVDFWNAQLREPVPLEWFIMRGVLAAGVIIALVKRRTDAVSEKLVAVGCLTVVLWLAAYPSAAIMHQWWTMSIGVAAFVACMRIAASWAADRWAAGKQLASPVAIAAVALILLPGTIDRIHAAEARVMSPRETITDPWLLKGVETDPQTHVDLAALVGVLRNYRVHHPDARLVSIDASDGWIHGVAESLLWLNLLDNNSHVHPIYWSMPVLSTITYPDYKTVLAEDIRKNHPLLGEARLGFFEPLDIEGYYLLYATYTSRGMYWYLYAPVHADSVQHHETTTVVRRGPPPPQAPDVSVRPADPQTVGTVAASAITAAAARISKPVRLEGRDVYRSPGDMVIPSPVPQMLEPLSRDAEYREDIFRFDDSGWSVDGLAHQPKTYLLLTKPSPRKKGDLFVARGELVTGGLSVGLQRDGSWVGQVAISKRGPFMVLLEVPDDGNYALAVSNDLTAPKYVSPRMIRWIQRINRSFLKNVFRVTSAGFTR